MIKGIDVSRWQGYINWPITARSIDFAIIKIGGSDVGFYQDGQATRNVLEARAQNLPIGFYVYLGGASSVQDEVNHIKNLINNIGGLRQGEPFVLDWEENHQDEVGYVYGIAKGLVDAGFPAPIIYMNLSYVRRNDWKRLVDLGCGVWIAAWGNNDDQPDTAPPSDEWPFWAIWQYSSTGTVPGISGRVDMNLFQGDVAAFKRYGSKGNVSMPSPVNTSKVVFPTGVEEYVVVKGDNLSMIAARWGKSWQELWNMNRDRVSNPNKIFPGLKLRVWQKTPQGSAAAKPAEPADNRKYYTVQPGDSLSSIAAKHGYPSYILLWEANKAQIPDPNLIRPNMRLVLP